MRFPYQRCHLLVVLAITTLAACQGGGTGQSAERTPVVLAASSLQESLSEAAARYAGDGRPQPVLSFAGTSSLARQVESRVSAQIIIAADEEWMDVLERQDLLSPGTRADLLTNELVLVIPGGAKRAEGMAPLAGDGRIAMADPAAVPAGRYGKAALESLGRWDEVAPRIVPTENVRAALALVGRGEVAAGIVYATDAQASQRVSVSYRFPPQSHPPIRYPAALLAAGDNEGGRRFLAFLRSDEARAIFRRHGFGIAR